MTKPRVLSGMQPSGDSLHLGNYLGALVNWVKTQEHGDRAIPQYRQRICRERRYASAERTASISESASPRRASPPHTHPDREGAAAGARPVFVPCV